MEQKLAVTAHIGDYEVPYSILVEGCLNYKMMKCPPTTKKTVELGAKNSPDTVCTPFKILLGNYIEALNQGANVLAVLSVGCRLGFYDVLHKQILKDLGYEFEVLNLFEYASNPNPIKVFRLFNELNPELTQEKFQSVLNTAIRVTIDMDNLADFMRRNVAFELKKGMFEKNYSLYLNEARTVKSADEAITLFNKYEKIFKNIAINKPQKPLRIGLIGDLYTVMEPHGNCEIEKWLARNSIEIIRPINLTYLTKTLFDPDSTIAKSGGYTKYYIGGNATNTVALAYEMASNEQVDGIIHMKAATCSPEITAMTILQNISKDYNLPVIYLTFDTETGEAGLHTRLEAFKDMLVMRKGEK